MYLKIPPKESLTSLKGKTNFSQLYINVSAVSDKPL